VLWHSKAEQRRCSLESESVSAGVAQAHAGVGSALAFAFEALGTLGRFLCGWRIAKRDFAWQIFAW